MVWFFKKKPSLQKSSGRSKIPSGLWMRCEGCNEYVLQEEVENNLSVCPKCDYHYRFPARARLELILDDQSFQELDGNLRASDPLRFVDKVPYLDRIRRAEEGTSESEAFLSGTGTVEGVPVQIGSFNFAFMGGSMGSVVGEKVTRLFERAFEMKQPAIVISASGGARMQEGVLSLMQMAKTSCALSRLKETKIPYISLLTDPTTGGVAASFSMLGDFILAEPNALIGFAGPRVIQQTIKEELPEGFQRSEFLLGTGFLDAIVERKDLRRELGRLLKFFQN